VYRNNTLATTHCNALQHTATHCSTLQHTATHCNTLQNTSLRQHVAVSQWHTNLCTWHACCRSGLSKLNSTQNALFHEETTCRNNHFFFATGGEAVDWKIPRSLAHENAESAWWWLFWYAEHILLQSRFHRRTYSMKMKAMALKCSVVTRSLDRGFGHF